jgi:DNA (cytosine-5)-methyltransferase 1
MINSQPICISLFTGAYRLDLGLEQARFHTVSVVEKDKDAAKTIAVKRATKT